MYMHSRKLIFWGLYFLGTTAFFLLIIEAVLRVFNPLGTDYIYEARRYFKIMRPDNIYGYIHRAGVKDVFQDVAVRINNEGFRGREFAVKKPEGVYRVLLLGDSVVFSWGVHENDSFAVQLEKMLQTKAPRKDIAYEVLPIGVGSWNTRTQYEFMVERGIEYHPDLVVWIIVANDLEPKSRGRTLVPLNELRARPQGLETSRWEKKTETQRRWLAEHSHLWAVVERYRRLGFIRRLNASYVKVGSPQSTDAKDAINKLSRLLKVNEVPVYAFIHGDNTSDFGLQYQALYQDFLTQAGIPFFKFPKTIYQRPYLNSLIDPHQNAKGIRIMVEEVSSKLAAVQTFKVFSNRYTATNQTPSAK